MALLLKTQVDLYNIFIAALQDAGPELTDTTEGSEIDKLGGATSVGASELTKLIVDQFNKTYFSLANGPEVTGGDDDLQTLAVDHFGDTFVRPAASLMTDSATFSRANAAFGAVLIPAGTVIKTTSDANGNVYRYETDSDVTLAASGGTSLSVTVSITALVAGSASNAGNGAITVIENSLLDQSIVVTNTGSSNGEDAEDDATYRETIRNLIESLAGATLRAVEAKALTVPGVATATAIEQMQAVKIWNIATSTATGGFFYIPVPILYIADTSGMASVALITAVKTAIDAVRACGVLIQVVSASAVSVAWTASYTLNPSGPNYSTLVNDSTMIRDSMKKYIQDLPVGTSFVRATANAAILAIWGVAGTNDLTAFSTSVPSGDVAATATQKMIAGTMSIA